MSIQIRFAQVYQLSLQLICIADRWDKDAQDHRASLASQVMESATDLVLVLAQGLDDIQGACLPKTLDDVATKLSRFAALVDVSGVLHAASAKDLQNARRIIRRARQHLCVLQTTGRPITNPPEAYAS